MCGCTEFYLVSTRILYRTQKKLKTLQKSILQKKVPLALK